jgi:hypothetical protein
MCRRPLSQKAVLPEDKLAMYVSRLATGSTYRAAAAEFDMSDRYATTVASAVARAIMAAFATEIAWPNRAEALRSRDVFLARTGIANCVAAMDGELQCVTLES